MNRVIFLLEEPSMKHLLEGLLPRLFPGIQFLCVSHEGKNDLEKSIPKKLRAWKEPGVRFVVVRDNDGGDCRRLKAHLQDLCAQGGRTDTLVRIACQELEAWYIGEPHALAAAFGNQDLLKELNKAKYRDPDSLMKPSAELDRFVPAFQKLSGARRLGALLTANGNRSSSFLAFLSGVRQMMEKGE